MMTLPPGRRRLTAALAALGVASCFLPSEPTERITFELTFGSPFRVPLGQTVHPLIRVRAGTRPLHDPVYRLEVVENRGFVRVDGTGRGLIGITRGQSPVRVVYTGSTGVVDTTFTAQAVVSSVSVAPSTFTLRKLGATVQLTAYADSLDLINQNPTVPQTAFTWSSQDPTIATVSLTGLVTALEEGNVAIRAQLDGAQGQANVGIVQPAAVVQVQPTVDTLRTIGRSTRFFAAAYDSTGALMTGARARWTSLNPAVATVDAATGVVTAVRAGSAAIIGRVGPAADTATLVVKQVVRLLFVSPSLDTLTAIADTGRVGVVAKDSSDALIPDVIVSWTSNDPGVATVDPGGLVTAHSNGIVLVTATAGSQSAFATIVVRQEVARAQIAEDTVTLNGAGATKQLTATAVDKNGYLVPGAGGLEWRSHFALVATVDPNGLVTARGNGRTAVTVSVAGRSDAVTVTVTGAPQELIAFESGNGIEAIRTDGTLRTILIPNTTGSGGYCYYSYYCGLTATDPAWSPNGTRLAYELSTYDYSSCYYGCFDVYTAWPDGSDAINLTGGGGSYNADPAWSPDGTQIAFASGRAMGSGIFVMNADGSNVRRVTMEGGGNPTWSPDGTRIAFDDDGDIFVVNADGSQLVRLTGPSDGNDFQPAWSPDGTRIAFVSNRGPSNDIWIMNVDRSGLVNLTAALAYPNSPIFTHAATPAWSPDGSRLSFAASHCFEDPNGSYSPSCQGPVLYIVNRDGTGLQALNADGLNPAWHAAGSLSPAATHTPAGRIRR